MKSLGTDNMVGGSEEKSANSLRMKKKNQILFKIEIMTSWFFWETLRLMPTWWNALILSNLECLISECGQPEEFLGQFTPWISIECLVHDPLVGFVVLYNQKNTIIYRIHHFLGKNSYGYKRFLAESFYFFLRVSIYIS